jgi:ppGpp synthetase/RelA/SpoT-type nucleotidyltranferase
MTFDRLTTDWRRYVSEQADYRAAAERVCSEIVEIAAETGISVRVAGREKSPSEFVKKAIRKRDEGYLEDPWAKITDKAGARAIVQLEGDVDLLAEAIGQSKTIEVLEPSDTRVGDPDQLRYRGLHLQVVAPGSGPRRECELQIRTEAQDLWSSVVSHRFLYKPLVQLPEEVKRSLYRLVALIELFDREVSRAVTEIRELDGYATNLLLEHAERHFLALVPHVDVDRALSVEILEAIMPSFSPTELHTYGTRLDSFVEERREELVQVLADYGPHSETTDSRYLLLSQPEGIVLLERLSSNSNVVNVWREAELPEALLVATAGVWATAV